MNYILSITNQIKKFAILIFVGLWLNPALAEEPVSSSYFGSVAIGKHDSTAYHKHGSAHKGSKSYRHEYKGAWWYFASAEDRDLFAAEPEKYSPAYNGFCSNALSVGNGLVKTDGTVWHIYGTQLHLFYAQKGLDRWQANDYDEMKADADAAWKVELSKLEN